MARKTKLPEPAKAPDVKDEELEVAAPEVEPESAPGSDDPEIEEISFPGVDRSFVVRRVKRK